MALRIWHLPVSENQCPLHAKWLYSLNLCLREKTGSERERLWLAWKVGRRGLWWVAFLKGPPDSHCLLFFIFCYSKIPVYCWCTAPGTGGTFLHWNEGFLKETTTCPLSVHLKIGQKRQMQYIQHKIQHWEQQKAVTKPQKEQKLPGYSWPFYKIKPSC